MNGLGFGLRSNRSVTWDGELSDLAGVNWQGPEPVIGVELPLPGVSAEASAPGSDLVFGVGVKALAGLALQFNFSELGRRVFDSGACF